MRNFLHLVLFSVGMGSFGLAGCGNTTPAGTPDLANTASMSCCGKPGDTGNSKGVGKYCTDPSASECKSNPGATICSALGDTPQRKTTFCTMPCKVTDVGFCGENASCTQDSATQVYGCTPNACTTAPPAGCSA